MSMNSDQVPARKPHIRQVVETFLVIGLGMALTVPPLVFWSVWSLRRGYIQRTGDELAAIFAQDARYPLLADSRKDAMQLATDIGKFPDLVGAALVRSDGQVLAAIHTRTPATRVHPVVRDVMPEDQEDPLPSGDTPGTPENTGKIGTVRLELAMDRAYRMSIDSAQQVMALLLALMLILGLAVTRLSARILAPLSRLAKFVETEQDLTTPLPTPALKSPREVQVIYHAVDAMRQRTAGSQNRLAEHADTLE